MPYPFDPKLNSIRVEAIALMPSGNRKKFVICLDTGATHTAIRFSRLKKAGFRLADAINEHDVLTANGSVRMYEFEIPELTCLGKTRLKLPVLAAHDLLGMTHDGYLGLNFFEDAVLTIDFRQGLIDLA